MAIRSCASAVKTRFQPYDAIPKDGSNAFKDHVKAEPPNCLQCGNNTKHYIWHCDAFRALAFTAQFEQLSKWGICEVCLRSKHKEVYEGQLSRMQNGTTQFIDLPTGKISKKANHASRKRSRMLREFESILMKLCI